MAISLVVSLYPVLEMRIAIPHKILVRWADGCFREMPIVPAASAMGAILSLRRRDVRFEKGHEQPVAAGPEKARRPRRCAGFHRRYRGQRFRCSRRTLGSKNRPNLLDVADDPRIAGGRGPAGFVGGLIITRTSRDNSPNHEKGVLSVHTLGAAETVRCTQSRSARSKTRFPVTPIALDARL
jgi:hypothetical protein